MNQKVTYKQIKVFNLDTLFGAQFQGSPIETDFVCGFAHFWDSCPRHGVKRIALSTRTTEEVKAFFRHLGIEINDTDMVAAEQLEKGVRAPRAAAIRTALQNINHCADTEGKRLIYTGDSSADEVLARDLMFETVGLDSNGDWPR